MLMRAKPDHHARPARQSARGYLKQGSARCYRLASRTEERAARGQTPRVIDRVHAV
jgi:hypothetical protein